MWHPKRLRSAVGEGRGEGPSDPSRLIIRWSFKLSQNRLQNKRQFPQHVVVRESNDPVAQTFNQTLPARIVPAAVIVAVPIQFDAQPSLAACEIDNEAVDWNLPGEFETC